MSLVSATITNVLAAPLGACVGAIVGLGAAVAAGALVAGGALVGWGAAVGAATGAGAHCVTNKVTSVKAMASTTVFLCAMFILLSY